MGSCLRTLIAYRSCLQWALWYVLDCTHDRYRRFARAGALYAVDQTATSPGQWRVAINQPAAWSITLRCHLTVEPCFSGQQQHRGAGCAGGLAAFGGRGTVGGRHAVYNDNVFASSYT